MLVLLSIALAETLFVATPGEGVRWPGSSFVSVKLVVGDEVEVLVPTGEVDPNFVRVRKGTDFGWVDPSLLTPVAPTQPTMPERLPFDTGSPTGN